MFKAGQMLDKPTAAELITGFEYNAKVYKQSGDHNYNL